MGEKLVHLQDKILPYSDRQLAGALSGFQRLRDTKGTEYKEKIFEALELIKYYEPELYAAIIQRSTDLEDEDPLSKLQPTDFIHPYLQGFLLGRLIGKHLSPKQQNRNSTEVMRTLGINDASNYQTVEAIYPTGLPVNLAGYACLVAKIPDSHPQAHLKLMAITYPRAAMAIGLVDALAIQKASNKNQTRGKMKVI